MKSTPQNRTLPDSIYFVTTNLIAGDLFTDPRAANTVTDTLQFYRDRGDINLHAFVIMPDHVHLLVQARGSTTLPRFMNGFKSYVSKKLGGRRTWQKGYWSEIITEARFAIEKIEYIHGNPVRAGLVELAVDYDWSSARDYQSGNAEGRIDLIELL